PLLPYTTLFRSDPDVARVVDRLARLREAVRVRQTNGLEGGPAHPTCRWRGDEQRERESERRDQAEGHPGCVIDGAVLAQTWGVAHVSAERGPGMESACLRPGRLCGEG